jgi:hypothetical protein
MLLNTFILIGAFDNHIIEDLMNLVQQTFTELIVHSIIDEVNVKFTLDTAPRYCLTFDGVEIRSSYFYARIIIFKINWYNNLYKLLPSLVMDCKNPMLFIKINLPKRLLEYHEVHTIVGKINPSGTLTDDQIIAEYKRIL